MSQSLSLSKDFNNEETERRLDMINETLLLHLGVYPHQSTVMYEAASYAVGSRGHRWRPILFLELYQNLTGKSQIKDVLPIASAIEFVHTASIILDDLPAMDNASLRRGKKTCHIEFGQPIAIMTASWLCDVAQHLIHEFQSDWQTKLEFDLESHMRATKNDMTRGQLMDLSSLSHSEDNILETYRLKSGVLYAFASSAPARILGMHNEAEHLLSFGNLLGISYQISDDVADLTGSSEKLGKNIGQDVDKKTLPKIHGPQSSLKIRDTYKQKAIIELKKLGRPVDDIIDLVERITFCS